MQFQQILEVGKHVNTEADTLLPSKAKALEDSLRRSMIHIRLQAHTHTHTECFGNPTLLSHASASVILRMWPPKPLQSRPKQVTTHPDSHVAVAAANLFLKQNRCASITKVRQIYACKMLGSWCLALQPEKAHQHTIHPLFQHWRRPPRVEAANSVRSPSSRE